MKYLFESERLGFRTWIDSDSEPFVKMNKNTEVMRYFPRTLSETESLNLIDKIQNHIKKRGFGLWAVEEKISNQFIGFIGLNYAEFNSSFTPCIEIGWRLDTSFWNRGYATEGASLCLQKGFVDFKLKEIYSFTSHLNHNSEKVMIKIGMQKILEFDHPNLNKNDPLCRHVLYIKRQK